MGCCCAQADYTGKWSAGTNAVRVEDPQGGSYLHVNIPLFGQTVCEITSNKGAKISKVIPVQLDSELRVIHFYHYYRKVNHYRYLHLRL